MSKPVAVANLSRQITLGVSLKLYLSVEQTAAWAREVARIAIARASVRSGQIRLFALPSLPALPAAKNELHEAPVGFGAQDLHWEDRGAFTGAISGLDLRAVGCQYVEVAHAERSSVFGETPEIARAKLAAALRNELTPVLCVGEPDLGDPSDAANECISQLEFLLEEQSLTGELIVAYEPVWAIGAPKPASAEHVQIVATTLGDYLEQRVGSGRSTVIYGGSAQPGTLTSLGGKVDGLFLGRFAHEPSQLEQMIDEAEALLDQS